MKFHYEGFNFSSFRRLHNINELIKEKKYLLISNGVYRKGVFLYHSYYKYIDLMHFQVGDTIMVFSNIWMFEFIEVKEKICATMELRALNMILKNLIDEKFEILK
jgi:hypothetical protein